MRIDDTAFIHADVMESQMAHYVVGDHNEHLETARIDEIIRRQLTYHVAGNLLSLGGYGVMNGTGIADAWIISDPEIDSGTAVLAPEVNDVCHCNAMMAVARNPTMRHMIGYALSSDGLWHEHSWVKDAQGVIGETTGTRRLAYVGVDISLVPRNAHGLLGGEAIDQNASNDLTTESVRLMLAADLRPLTESMTIIADAYQRRAYAHILRKAA